MLITIHTTNIDDIEINKKNMFIIGKPAAGKTHISYIFSGKYPHHALIHTDDFICVDRLINKLNELSTAGINYIVEGNKISKIAQIISLSQSIFMDVYVDDYEIFLIYSKERNINKFEHALNFYNEDYPPFIRYLKNINQSIPYFIYNNSHNLSKYLLK